MNASNSGNALMHASPTLRANRSVALRAVTNHGGSLMYASTELQDDRDLVLVAIRQFGMALEFASPRLKNDFFIARIAIHAFGEALDSDRLRNARRLALGLRVGRRPCGAAGDRSSRRNCVRVGQEVVQRGDPAMGTIVDNPDGLQGHLLHRWSRRARDPAASIAT